MEKSRMTKPVLLLHDPPDKVIYSRDLRRAMAGANLSQAAVAKLLDWPVRTFKRRIKQVNFHLHNTEIKRLKKVFEIACPD